MSSEHKILARIPISVRWRDMDSMGHVNNAKYISYLEEARVRGCRSCGPTTSWSNCSSNAWATAA
jgi:acyl-CoA thioesterase FadM